MTCRRLHFHRHFNPITLPFLVPQIRYKSSRPRIQVVSNPARVQHPTQQDHKWSFLTETRQPTTSSRQEDEPPSPLSDVADRGDVGYDRTMIIRQAIDFTHIEKRTFEYLRKTEDYINEKRTSEEEKVAAYFVGGWVRDKLLGKQPPDMDIVLQNITPVEFVQTLIDVNGFNSHSPRLIPLPEGEKISVPKMMTGKPRKQITVGTHKFEYDAGDGKTFQVAGVILFDTLVRMEFIELKPGVGEEDKGQISLSIDAFQRELTVNAIYLKVRNLALLDPTGSGFNDLRWKLFQTPKVAKSTFLDDPIRVIRLIRFASRFYDDGFTVDKNTLAASMDPEVRLALTTRFPPNRINRELSILLQHRNNPSRVLRIIHQTKYYRDFFSPPSPVPTPSTYIPPSIPSTKAEYVTASWFIEKLVSEWELWTPFEEALLSLPTATNRAKNKNHIRDLIILRQNVQTLAYAICIVMPWRNYPDRPVSGEAKTFAGSIVGAIGQRLMRRWDLIDQMFDEDSKTVRALEVVDVDSMEKAVEFKKEYGEFWAGWVLCAAIFKWCEMCKGEISEEGLKEIWSQSQSYWRNMASAVDKIRWDNWKKEKKT